MLHLNLYLWGFSRQASFSRQLISDFVDIACLVDLFFFFVYFLVFNPSSLEGIPGHSQARKNFEILKYIPLPFLLVAN